MKKRLNYLLLTVGLVAFKCSMAFAQSKIEQWQRFEIVFQYAAKSNSFLNVNLTATFKGVDTSYTVSGFYDGDNTFKIRFMPEKIGTWTYTTQSNIAELNNNTGSFDCVKATGDNHGIVRVSNTYHFKYADGKDYFPFGTTAYAWTHMTNDLQEETLLALKKTGFNKIRMCVFPKNYELVKEEPEIFPYVIKSVSTNAKGEKVYSWDFNQFNPAYFQHLEKRLDDLKGLGIEADLILFHPYDKGRWGFDVMPMEANLLYIKYLSARLASFKNVWWSLANEYDYVKSKTEADWTQLIHEVVKQDPFRHLCSIHGSTAKYYNYWIPELTHASIQDESPVINWGAAAIVRSIYNKPIIFDEVGYEGNLKLRWGWYSGEEMNHLIWMGLIGGTYVTHGEAFMVGDGKNYPIFWAKGGELRGTSWKRAAFNRQIIEETGALEMADISRDFKTATNGKGTYIIYFGKEMSETWRFNLPNKNATFEKPKKGNKYKVEIIDTWDMSVQKVETVFELLELNNYRFYDKNFGFVRLPLKPYLALRITEIVK